MVDRGKGTFYFEWPAGNEGWKQPLMQEVAEKLPFSTEIDGCAYGLTNSKTGLPINKTWRIQSSNPQIKDFFLEQDVSFMNATTKSEEKKEKQLKAIRQSW